MFYDFFVITCAICVKTFDDISQRSTSYCTSIHNNYQRRFIHHSDKNIFTWFCETKPTKQASKQQVVAPWKRKRHVITIYTERDKRCQFPGKKRSLLIRAAAFVLVAISEYITVNVRTQRKKVSGRLKASKPELNVGHHQQHNVYVLF